MAYQYLSLDTADRTGIVTINHPPANVLSPPVLEDLERVFGELKRQDAIKVIVLTGAGRFFSTGADIRVLSEIGGPQEASELSRVGQTVMDGIEQSEKPVLAAINGACLGGGLELAMACHLRIASTQAVLGLPEVKLGLIPGFGGTQRLPRLVGPARAAELVLTGEPVSAEEALTLGLVNRIVPAQDVLSQTSKLAETIAGKSRLAIGAALRALRAGRDGPFAEGLLQEGRIFGELFSTEDMREGTRAFLDKRTPQFHDR